VRSLANGVEHVREGVDVATPPTPDRHRRPIGVAARLAALTALAFLMTAAVGVGGALAPRSQAAAPVHVHAQRAGLPLGLQALTGRVALVASRAGLRWRIPGATGWHRARGRVLVRGWDTRTVPDGAYTLELESREGTWVRPLVVRNYAYLRPPAEATASSGLDTRQHDGRAVVAAFHRRSYRPGDVAVLGFARRYPRLRIQLLHVGPERRPTIGNQTMNGVPVGPPRHVTNASRHLRLPIGDWESGVYTARITAGRRVGFAPFVVRPRRLGTHDVAVVQPTNTWQAYNYRSVDGDGLPDTWYYSAWRRSVDVSRPYLNRGVPPHFRAYDVGFLGWLAHRGEEVDMLAQEDVERLSGAHLARMYRLIVFSGHHEYVTADEYDAVQRYRDLGGHLAFLSANNFYWRVRRDGNLITRIGLWRDLGRPEAALVGVQYIDWNLGRYPNRQYVVTGSRRSPWFFAGTGLRAGGRFGWWGIEADGRAAASPRTTRVLATMRNVFGTGRPAEMTYYETARGARVFAAGAFTLAGMQARRWTTSRILDNLWDRLAGHDGSMEKPPRPR
jgi:N,N-dimethylformamidase beta subunit-like protein